MHEHRTGPGKLTPIEKAAKLIAEDRVRLVTEAAVYVVEGDTDAYYVSAGADGIRCPCQARTPLCSHVLAVAHLRGAERAKTNGDSLTEGALA